MTLIVTGGYGFIGANLVHALNRQNRSDILVVDDLSDRVSKFKNLITADFSDYLDRGTLLNFIAEKNPMVMSASGIFHQGACSDTMNHDGKYMMENNFEYSKILFHFAQSLKIPFIYASSAATYGNSQEFAEIHANEAPLNIYGYSKLLFDRYLERYLQSDKLTAPVFGLRYFNVYGPYENHKERMASVAFHHYHQLKNQGYVNLFGAYDGIEKGEQRRDFVFVDDVVSVNLWLFKIAKNNPELAIEKSGYLNVGTGNASSFNELSLAVINGVTKEDCTLSEVIEAGQLRYIEFPESLKGKYQSYTRADISKLRELGYDQEFHTVQAGVKKYVEWLHANKG